MNLTEQERERFLAKVDRSDPAGCWTWSGEIQNKGYGRFLVYRGPGGRQRKRYLAHRVAFMIANGGEVPAVVRHRCDNPPCCRPDHLLPGTQRTNIQDAIERGRMNVAGLADRRARSAAGVRDRLRTGRKVCSSCQAEKGLADFAANRSNPDGRAYYCNDCFSARYAGGRRRRRHLPVS